LFNFRLGASVYLIGASGQWMLCEWVLDVVRLGFGEWLYVRVDWIP